MKYAHYNKDTLELLGWYTEDIHGDNIPTPNLPCTDEYWSEALASRFNKVDLVNENLFYEESFLSFKDRRVNEESLNYERTLSNDLVSDALGTDYIYPSDYFDDSTIAQCLIIGGSHKLKCRPVESEAWGFVMHTDEQIKLLASKFMQTKQSTLEIIENIKNISDQYDTKEQLDQALNSL